MYKAIILVPKEVSFELARTMEQAQAAAFKHVYHMKPVASYRPKVLQVYSDLPMKAPPEAA